MAFRRGSVSYQSTGVVYSFVYLGTMLVLNCTCVGPGPPKNICIFQSSNPRGLLRCYVQQNQEASGADCKSLGRVCFDTVSRNMGVSWTIHKERV